MATVVGKDHYLLKRCTCDRCASLIDYAPRDVYSENTKDILHNTRTPTGNILGTRQRSFVVCPECRNKVLVNTGPFVPNY